MSRRLRRWHSKRKRVHVQRVGEKRGRLENYINQGRFWPGENEAERRRGFTEKPHRHVRVCSSRQSPTLSFSLYLSHSTHTYLSGNKKKRSRLYFYTSALLSFSAIQQVNDTECSSSYQITDRNWCLQPPCLFSSTISIMPIASSHAHTCKQHKSLKL